MDLLIWFVLRMTSLGMSEEMAFIAFPFALYASAWLVWCVITIFEQKSFMDDVAGKKVPWLFFLKVRKKVFSRQPKRS